MRQIVNGIFYVMQVGCPWLLMPNDLQPWGNLPMVRRLARDVSALGTVRYGSDSDRGGRRANVRYHPRSGPNLAKPFDLRRAVTLSVNARLRYRFRRLGAVIREIPVE